MLPDGAATDHVTVLPEKTSPIDRCRELLVATNRRQSQGLALWSLSADIRSIVVNLSGGCGAHSWSRLQVSVIGEAVQPVQLTKLFEPVVAGAWSVTTFPALDVRVELVEPHWPHRFIVLQWTLMATPLGGPAEFTVRIYVFETGTV